jgi:hypothetical protein
MLISKQLPHAEHYGFGPAFVFHASRNAKVSLGGWLVQQAYLKPEGQIFPSRMAELNKSQARAL